MINYIIMSGVILPLFLLVIAAARRQSKIVDGRHLRPDTAPLFGMANQPYKTWAGEFCWQWGRGQPDPNANLLLVGGPTGKMWGLALHVARWRVVMVRICLGMWDLTWFPAFICRKRTELNDR